MPSKQEILAEIRRTTVANGGAPLGMARFEQQTGIKAHEWGKYWARFGDALRDAGFAGNQMQGPLSDDFIVMNLIKLARKLGKFPTSREIEVERLIDADMPSRKVFQRRGGKEGIAKLVGAYCASHEGFDDVAALCNTVTHKNADNESDHEVADRDVALGEVYLGKMGKYHKIGS